MSEKIPEKWRNLEDIAKVLESAIAWSQSDCKFRASQIASFSEFQPIRLQESANSNQSDCKTPTNSKSFPWFSPYNIEDGLLRLERKDKLAVFSLILPFHDEFRLFSRSWSFDPRLATPGNSPWSTLFTTCQ